jgi:hypothetical protein
MLTAIRFLLLGLCLAFFSGCATSEQSLYNKKTAQKLSPNQIAKFGPQSGRYRYDARMVRAAQIAQDRARSRSTSRCWRYVKDALLASKTIETRPTTGYAKQAAAELSREYGFQKLRVSDPYLAPLGAVLVYGGKGAGHVEIRTKQGFVSDFVSMKPSPRPLIGVFVKPKAG